MKIIIASSPLMGHLTPLLSICDMLMADGHEIVGLTGHVFRDEFTGRGARFHPLPGNADMDLRDLDKAFPGLTTLDPGPQRFHVTHRKVFIEPIVAQSRGLSDILQKFAADLIIADSSFFGTLPLLLSPRESRPAIIHCGITVLQYHRDDRAPYGAGLPPAATDAERALYRKIALRYDVGALGPLRQTRDEFLKVLGFEAPELDLFDAQVCLPDAYIQLTVPDFEYPRHDLPPSVAFVGQPALPVSELDLPGWANDLDASRSVILVTQGTVANRNLGQLITPALAAFANSENMTIVVTTGRRPFDAIPGPVPANARLAEFVPYGWLMPKIDALITNGGYGTVNQALKHGVPVVVAGLTEDKADVGARVQWCGAGINLGTNEPTPEALNSAVRAILGDSKQRTRAALMKEKFAGLDTRTEMLRIMHDVINRRRKDSCSE